jgi:hypothetical protein
VVVSKQISKKRIIQGTTYGSSVVGLAKVTVNTGGGGGVNDAAVLLLEEVWPSGLGDLVGTTEMDVHDIIPHLVVHVGEGLVAEDTSVVDEDIDAAIGVNGVLHNSITILARSLGWDGLAASLPDLSNDVVWVDEVVDDELSATLGERKSVRTTDTSTGTGDEDDLVLEVDILGGWGWWELLGLLEESEEVGWAGWVLSVLEVVDVVPLLEEGTWGVGVQISAEESAGGTLPADLGNVATADLEDGAVLLDVLVDEDGNEWDNPLWLEGLQQIRWHNSLGHAGCGNWRNDVSLDVVLGALLCEGLGETDKRELGSRVVGLAEGAEETSSRGSVDDTAVLLLAKVWPCGPCALVCALDVDIDDEVPVLVGQVLEGDITQDTGVVDEDINAAEGLDGGLDDLLALGDRVVVGNGLAASGLDLVDNNIGCLCNMSD